MKTKAVRLYGKKDVRLEEFELPEIQDDEILVKCISDSICMSTWKTIQSGKDHKRVPDNIDTHPVIIGHEFAGDIIQVGSKWKNKFHEGNKFAQQPAIPGQMESPGYSYEYYGGACTYCIIPNDVIEKGCIWEYEGNSYYHASLAEPMSCCIGGFHSNYHNKHLSYEHIMGTKENGDIIILGGCGPMGLGAISYALATENKPKRVVVTDVDDSKIQRAKKLISTNKAREKGIELIYINTSKLTNPEQELKRITEMNGFSDVFVFVPIKEVAELGNKILSVDGCMNFFAGPIDNQFSANINLYDCHYSRTKILGSSGGNTNDMKEAIELSNQGKIDPSVMVTHIGGIDCVAQATSNLPNIAGGKKLTYNHINMPLTAIKDLSNLSSLDPFFIELDNCCKKHNGLWSPEAEKLLLEHFKVI